MTLCEVARPPVDWDTRSEKDQIAMVSRNAYNIHKITTPSEAVQLAAIRKRGDAIGHIKNPSETVQLVAVNQDGYAIVYINDPSEAVQLAAVNQNGYNIRFIKSPSSELIKLALQHPKFINDKGNYERVVNYLFSDNSILTKKWLRYGEAMRNKETV
jgi:hypothetical protein